MRLVAPLMMACLSGTLFGQADDRARERAVAAEICRYIDVRGLEAIDEGLQLDGLPLRVAPARLSEVLSRWGRELWPASHPRQVDFSGGVIHAHGAPEVVRAAERAIAQLRGAEVGARLHCSVLQLPQAALAAARLKPGAAAACDEPTITKLTRDAASEGGKLRNLPEMVAAPLRPFAMEHAESGVELALRLRWELVPLGPDDALLGLHAVRGELPKNIVQLPEPNKQLLTSPVLRLTTGGVSVVALPEGSAATVLVVRCVELGPAVKAAPSTTASPRR